MHNKKLYGTATVGTKGQIVIPADARDELGIKPGDRLYVIGSPEAQTVTFIQEERMEEFIDRINLHMQHFQDLKKNHKG